MVLSLNKRRFFLINSLLYAVEGGLIAVIIRVKL